jgi:hypothetical protein
VTTVEVGVLKLILEHWNIPIDLLALFLDHSDGLALLALLCDAGAKDWPGQPGDPRLYAHKANTVRWACLARPIMARQASGEADLFRGGIAAARRPAAPARVSFPPGDTLPDLPAHWPAANRRGWCGQQAQSRVMEIARSYLAGRGVSL